MCGIVGYIGKNGAKDILLDGLSKLEYRGYDSAGISVLNKKITTVKAKGQLKNLVSKCEKVDLNGNVGIGHTRWATHGEPSDINSHPHLSMSGKISVVHNGIIENYEELKSNLIKDGVKFVSETDTEVLPHLIEKNYNGDLLDAVIKTTKALKGSYALGIISEDEPDKIIAVRKDSPLIVGLGNGENFIASDIPAILKHTKEVYLLNDNEFVILKKDSVKLVDFDKNEIKRDVYKVDFDDTAAQKGGFDHFMIKEIYEQPQAIKSTLNARVAKGEKIVLDNIGADDLKDISRVFIVACGTAYHAGLVGKTAIERLSGIPVDVDIASEFRYRNPILDKNTLVMVISQSGETADTLAALRLAKEHGCKTFAITNVVGSSVSREADFVFYTHAGPEIAVASTKAYITQLIALYIFALYMAQDKNYVEKSVLEDVKSELLTLPEKVKEALKTDDAAKKIADDIYKETDIFYLGRGLDYAVAMEGSLKLKEISYIHSEPYAGGELKHGPIALIEKGTVVIALNTNNELKGKMESNIKEVVTRGAYIVGILPEGFTDIGESYDKIIKIPDTIPLLAPVTAVVPLQLLSYYVAIKKGCNVDKPRNLAKSVTVE
ncbi:MAG: glutamine--fructose-6-phosphate transaminase (isomerizing) [Oscillospiraceae bacterium]|nr:glutamine--fructose-6-phosphate transaminase (isomerizing) [Oscillospiraceae bacterium]